MTESTSAQKDLSKLPTHTRCAINVGASAWSAVPAPVTHLTFLYLLHQKDPFLSPHFLFCSGTSRAGE